MNWTELYRMTISTTNITTNHNHRDSTLNVALIKGQRGIRVTRTEQNLHRDDSYLQYLPCGLLT